MKNQNRRRIKEFGDFQTPPELAHSIVNFLKANGVNPATIVEPTCGTGSFVLASINTFPDAAIIGIDINSNYVNFLKNILPQKTEKKNINIKQGDFFKEDWNKMINLLQEPILTVGNPPWITSATMTLIDGDNLPIKTNIHEFSGIEAKTGKSNFDISEWVIITLLKSLSGHHGILAMICKTSVARKALIYCNRNELSISNASMHLINGKKYFNVTVDICLFICHLIPNFQNYTCQIYPNLNYSDLIHEIGIIDNELIADIPNYQKWRHLRGNNKYVWRSGIKHDCTKVMELTKEGNRFFNGYGEKVTIEETFLFPMLKSSDLANNRINDIKKWMIVPQKHTSDDTSTLKETAPLTWDYFNKYGKNLDTRASSIYRNRPRFSIFGVGDYSFSRWKIAISGLYKQTYFRLIQPFKEKPVVLDDTCYFITSNSYEEAVLLHILLNTTIAKEFYSSYIHWDAKRPITKQILQYLDIGKLYQEIGSEFIQELHDQRISSLNIDSIEKILVDDPLKRLIAKKNRKGESEIDQ